MHHRQPDLPLTYVTKMPHTYLHKHRMDNGIDTGFLWFFRIGNPILLLRSQRCLTLICATIGRKTTEIQAFFNLSIWPPIWPSYGHRAALVTSSCSYLCTKDVAHWLARHLKEKRLRYRPLTVFAIRSPIWPPDHRATSTTWSFSYLHPKYATRDHGTTFDCRL